ncbi:unnamed protein product [Clonostachys rhizophaga]|uniref:Uncharacterized protein n=1 Tax=Clonostachys rhizophaga TaxID=160324 RepID=A0A9N9VYA8_9HYPO|nr:unnamed protein product [Clonostachys rhizophaga]
MSIGIKREGRKAEQKLISGWHNDKTQNYLDTLLRRTLGAPESVDTHTFPDYFTLRDLERMGNFRVRFTDNLLQHLRVMKHRDDWFRPTVYIFQHANVLKKLSESGPTDDFKKLAKEGLMTMALLMPPDQRPWFDSAIWLNERLDGEQMIDRTIGTQWRSYPSHRSHQASNYDYWQRRLLILEEEFNNASPSRIRAWWYDARKGRDWALLWVQLCGFGFAIAAFLLAAVSTLVAALQAVEANRYAQQANTLALLANEYASNASTLDANQADPMTTFTTILVTGVTNFISTNVNQINYNQATPAVGAREAMAVITAEPSL